MAAAVRRRRFPIIGDGGGVFSHVNIDDAATAAWPAQAGAVGGRRDGDDRDDPARGSSNASGRSELDWTPRYASLAPGLRDRAGVTRAAHPAPAGAGAMFWLTWKRLSGS